MSVFKAYDIRGTYPDQIDANLARRIGRAYADFLGQSPVVVGRDMRSMAPEIQDAFIEGVRDGGLDVVNAGLCSTPQLYFAIGYLKAAGGVNVTASHNPSQYIGFKLCREEAKPISADDGIREIEAMATHSDAPTPVAARGTLEEVDVMEEYLSHVLQWADLKRPLVLASDAANGMACHTFPRLLERLAQIQHRGLYFDLDGRFPNHEANPLNKANLVDLQKLVLESGADLGAAFDGDADRCCFVDEKGRAIGNDIITTLVAQDVLSSEPGAAIIYDLRSSWVLPEQVLAGGGKPVKERVGHSFLKARMREYNAPFGGELSGHYYFRDNWFADNSEIILLSVMNLISRSDKPFSAMLDELMPYHSTGEVNFKVEDKLAAIEKLKNHYSDAEQDSLDGITIAYGDPAAQGWWWVNLRMSNTEPLLRMNLESDSLEVMENRTTEVMEILGVEPEDG
ncbi:MAG: phosphomannomutase/phosphoglucomutase [Planctomycetes bacterium]|jgi:phosphomannomutase|nr:phosphomannomutase/phosphoglucomutase [Planctomycetota bacterium]MDP7245322.1 phosphomannomutase/phosphoglucomutase [Planctomycetota bacterium]|tara:strand:+ start:11074 stop:12435 length:1362 start_codon:yes stop_codon:yes gene_type:complete